MSERVLAIIPENIPDPYDTWVEGRNGSYGMQVARILGVDESLAEVIKEPNGQSDNCFLVLYRPITSDEATKYGAKAQDVLGVVQNNLIDLAAKTNLHPAIDGMYPSNHDHTFYQEIKNATLPGLTAVSIESAQRAYQTMSAGGQKPVRLKHPSKSDSDGQKTVSSPDEASKFIQSHFETEDNVGLVVELNVSNPKTISIGEITIGGITYTRIGIQDEVNNHEGRNVFGGGVVQIIEGTLEEVTHKFKNTSTSVTTALKQASSVISAIKKRVEVANYVACDVVQGEDSEGNFVSGVTDLTMRVGGLTGAELLAIDEMRKSGKKMQVAYVRLDYLPDGSRLKEEVLLLKHNLLEIRAGLA